MPRMTACQHLPLNTPRLQLRPLVPEDASALYALHADPQVMRYWSSPAWTRLAQAERMIEQDQQALARGDHLRLALVPRSGGPLIGLCSLFNGVPACRRAELGYILSAAAWGQGYMHEALQALLRHGFEVLDLNRIEADIDPRNTASARALQRLGFELEGLLRERWIVNGEVSDSGWYGLLRSRWVADQSRSGAPSGK